MSKVTPNFLEGIIDSTLKNDKNNKRKKKKVQEVKNGKKRVTFVADEVLWNKFLSYAYTSRQTVASAMIEMMTAFLNKKEQEITFVHRPPTRRKRP